MNRRTFLGVASAGIAGLAAKAGAESIAANARAASVPTPGPDAGPGPDPAAAPTPFPIIDTHIHLFDITRPQGVPWPPKDNAILYHSSLPARYREVTKGLGIVGAIEIECSNWLEDNQWVLDTEAKDTIMVGTIGDLEPGKPDFRKNLDRFHKNPLYLGIRYGNLWDRDFSGDVERPEFVSDMQAFADANLTLDTAMPSPALLAALIRLMDKVPNLRAVIDHIPQLDYPTEPKALAQLEANLRELAKRPQLFVKVSEVARRDKGEMSVDLNFYRPRLDKLYDIFGPDKLIYASDWPNSDQWTQYPQVFNLYHEYFLGKGQAVAEKFFWKNSVPAYKWIKRAPNQPSPASAA